MEGHPQIVLITGPMFSEKTAELIRKCKRHQVAGVRVKIFKPEIDTRVFDKASTEVRVESRCGAHEDAIVIKRPIEILSYADSIDVAGIDEAQLWGDECADELLEVVWSLFKRSKTVYITALDTDYNAKPFKIALILMPIPEVKILKLTAVCFDCRRRDATRSFRIIKSDQRIVVGDSNAYIALCYDCFVRRTA